jgi:hypothetical protein
MKIEYFKKLSEELIAEANQVSEDKQKDYARDFDALDNFKSIALITGLTPQQVWSVYFYKHISAVMAWAREGKVESESLKSRFIDIINYAKLGYGLEVEDEIKYDSGVGEIVQGSEHPPYKEKGTYIVSSVY